MLTTALFGLLTIAWAVGIVLWIKRRNIQKLMDRMPGPKTVPIFGNALQFPTDSKAFYLHMESLCMTYRDSGFYRLWFGPHLVVLIYRADLLEILFSSSKNIKKSFFYRMLEPWLKTGLLTSTGEKWHIRRKMITPTFHFKILEEFLDVMNEHVQIMIEILDGKAEGEPFDVQPLVAHCTLDIICDSAMGCHVDAQHKESEYIQALYRVSDDVISRVKQPWLWPEFLFRMHPLGRQHYKSLNILHEFTRKVIKKRSAEFDVQWEKLKRGEIGAASQVVIDDSTGAKPLRIGKRMVFLDMLLYTAKNNPSLTEDDIQEEVDTFMFEGHDTTAATAVWALYVIGKHPEIQAKLHQEVDRIFGDEERPVTMEDLNQLKYTECVFKESMRLYPTVPFFGREFSEDCEFEGCFVPKGSTAFVMSYPLHRDPKYFPDPDKFDPDRWLTDNPTDKHPFAYVPFSAGFRNCIGQKFAVMEEKVLLSSILRKFNITCTEPDNIDRSGLLVLRPTNGLHIKLTRRNP